MARLPAKEGSVWGGTFALALAALLTAAASGGSVSLLALDLGTVPAGCVTVAVLPIPGLAAGGAYGVHDVRSTCSCLKVLAFPAMVEAGGVARLHIGLLPAHAGPFRHSLWLTPENAGQAPVEQVVTGRAEGGTADVAPDLWDLPVALLRVRRVAPDAGLYTAPEALVAPTGQGSPNPVIVYVGPTPATAGARLPRALALPLSGIEHAVALRGRPVLLVDDGWNGPDLEAACQRLRRSGTPAAILDGGLGFVTQAAGTDPGARKSAEPAGLPPAIYYRVRGLGDWHVIDMTPGESTSCDLLFPGRLRADTATAVRDAAQQIAEDHRAHLPMPGVLVVNETGSYTAVGASLASGPPLRCRLFVLDGGWRALIHYLRSQAALADRRKLVAGPVSGCRDCP